jgi:hypothetical protein
MKIKKIELPIYGIVVKLQPDGSGSIESDLERARPDDCEGGSEEDTSYDLFNGAMDGIEALILAHAVAGVDIQTPAYINGVQTAVDVCDANLLG